MVTKGVVAIIPARGGSRRIRGKNIVDFHGKPLIAWTIEAALSCGIFDRVFVSTDDEEIADVSRRHGVEVAFLRDDKTDDISHSYEATRHALQQLRDNLDEAYQIVVQLLPTCPLRRSETIVTAYRNFQETGAEFQISCYRPGWINPWWAYRLDENSKPSPLFPDAFTRRSQDLEPLYCVTGAIWIATAEGLEKSGTFYGPGHILHEIDIAEATDIDDEADLRIARALGHVLL